MTTPIEYEAQIMEQAADQSERFRISTYLGAMRVMAKHLGKDRAKIIHTRAGLLIASYAEAPEEKPS